MSAREEYQQTVNDYFLEKQDDEDAAFNLLADRLITLGFQAAREDEPTGVEHNGQREMMPKYIRAENFIEELTDNDE